jgi:CDGSH-type Zn-finger protein
MRIITRSAQQPLKLDPQSAPVWLCRCGLSSDGIFCDGSHTSTLGEKKDQLYVYQGLTLERSLAQVHVLADKSQVVIDQGEDWQIICFKSCDALFDQVIAQRKAHGDDNLVDRYDLHARHYGLFVHGVLSVTLRVNYCKDGPLDCGSYYPPTLTQGLLSQEVGSASRLLKSRDSAVKHQDVKCLIRSAWKHGLASGIHCDVINTTTRMAVYYERIGYKILPRHRFIHPRLGTDSLVMVFSPFLSKPDNENGYISAKKYVVTEDLLTCIQLLLADS